MPTSGVVADSKTECGPGLTADECLWRGAGGAPWPPRAGFEARRLGRQTSMVKNLVGSGAEPRVRPATVVSGEVEAQFLLHGSETVRDQDQAPGALVLDGSNATLDHGQAAVLA